MKQRIGVIVMMLAVMSPALQSHGADCKGTLGQKEEKTFDVAAARKAAVKFMREDPSYGAKDKSIGFQRSNSGEISVEGLERQNSYIREDLRAGSFVHAANQAMIERMKADPSLRVFSIWLTTQEHYGRSQNIFQVERWIENGEEKVRVIPNE